MRPSFSPGGSLYLGVSPGIVAMRLNRTLTALLFAAIAIAWLAGPPSAPAQQRQVPAAGELRLSYAPVVQRVAPAVVNVYAAKVVQTRNPLFEDPIFRRFFGVPGGDGGGRQIQRSLGSGVIVDPSGLVVTNVHVIEGADEVKVALADKREFEAEIVLKDKRSDLAVLRIKDAHERFPVLDFANSDALEVGDIVLAIGDPFGVGQTVTHGIVSALARTQVGITDYQFFIQTDAPINPGNSGGALVDMNGRLVGTSSFLNIKPERQTVEIGATFLHPDVRAGFVNPAAKLLMLERAFACGARRVELLTDLRNARSQAAIAKLGAVREGVLRRDRITWTGHVRDSVLFAITDLDWPDIRAGLLTRLGTSPDMG